MARGKSQKHRKGDPDKQHSSRKRVVTAHLCIRTSSAKNYFNFFFTRPQSIRVMMASNNIDIPLDTFIKHTKKVGFPQKRLQQQRGLRTSGGGGVGGPQKRLSVEFKGQTGDLRAKLGGKKKADIVDLRAKLKPKALSTKQLKSKLTSAQNSQRPQKIKSEQFTLQSQPSRKSDPGPVAAAASHKRRKSPVRLPTYEEAKKISVTVPGLNKPVSQVYM